MNSRIATTLRQSAVPWLLFGCALWLALSSVPASSLPKLWRGRADIGMLAIPMTAIMLTGGIDLSVGSIVALAGVVLGLLYRDAQWPIGLAAMGGVAAGMLAGMFNGALVAYGIAPLVVTLATMALFGGLAMALVDGERIGNLPTEFTSIGQQLWLGFPMQFWLLVVVAVGFWILVHHTAYGRSLFAIGENRLAAQFAAIRVRRHEWLLYLLSGTVAGIVGVGQCSYNAAAVPDIGQGFELEAIACVVLGGTRVTGGFGSIGRTLLGLATLAHLQIGLRLIGHKKFFVPGTSWPFQFDSNVRLIIVGILVVLVAVLNERLAGRRRE